MSTFDIALTALSAADADTGKMTKALATQITGGLSNPSKMPEHAWGTPAWECKIGSKLRKIEGSVCFNCYATKHAYTWPNVRAAYQRRFERIYHPRWVEAMVYLIQSAGDKHFRWKDSGDLDSVEELRNIVRVCVLLPETAFWLPCREYETVLEYLKQGGTIPSNLTIRLSAHMVDGPAPTGYGFPTSTVHSSPEKLPACSVRCSAYDEKPHNCKDCRACWDRTVQNVSYLEHD